MRFSSTSGPNIAQRAPREVLVRQADAAGVDQPLAEHVPIELNVRVPAHDGAWAHVAQDLAQAILGAQACDDLLVAARRAVAEERRA